MGRRRHLPSLRLEWRDERGGAGETPAERERGANPCRKSRRSAWELSSQDG